MPKSKPILYLVGNNDGPPTLEDILTLAKQMTGRDPTLRVGEDQSLP
jgi:hypothetical protein